MGDLMPDSQQVDERLLLCPFCGEDCAVVNDGCRHVNGEHRVYWFVAFCCGQLDDRLTHDEARDLWQSRNSVAPPVSLKP